MKRELKYVKVKKSQSTVDVDILEKTTEDFDYQRLETESDAEGLIEEILEAKQLLETCDALTENLQDTAETEENSSQLPRGRD